MASSGTWDFQLTTADCLLEAFDRCGRRPTSLTRDDLQSGRRSLNLELISWNSRGVNLWKVIAFTVQIVANQATYAAGTGVTNIPKNLVSMLDVYISQINGGGSGIDIDRILLPMSRTDYAQFSNKLQPGQPSMYWFEKTSPPSFTLYQSPLQGYPTYQVSGYAIQRIQDANIGGTETPDIDILALDALCAMLADRLGNGKNFCTDSRRAARLEKDAVAAWALFMETNREDVDIQILPDYGGWLRNN